MTLESVTPENAAILIQKHMRGYLHRDQFIAASGKWCGESSYANNKDIPILLAQRLSAILDVHYKVFL